MHQVAFEKRLTEGDCCVSLKLFQWTAWTRRAQAEGYVSRESATALWDGVAQDVRAPGPPAWTSALDTELSWQTLEHAAVILTGQAMTALQVSAFLSLA